MINILFFGLGVLFIVLILPLIQELSELMCLMLETLKSIFAKIVAKKNLEIEELNAPEVNTNAIGFEIPSCIEEEYFEEEEKHKNKIGF